MRRMTYIVAVVAMMLVVAAEAAPTAQDLATIAAGRIRYVEGNGARMSFGDATVTPDLDYLVLVGATFRTGTSRLELATLNGDVFWLGPDTDFHFEASDPDGLGTTLFLGQGSVVVKTAAPFNLVTSAGTLHVPGDGTYNISKERVGTRYTSVATLAGEPPTVIKRATLFSRFTLDAEADKSLLAWSRQRQENWRATLWRADLFSRVGQLPPMVAYTDSGGERQWRRVAHAGPLSSLASWLRDDLWVGGYDPGRLHTLGVLPAGLDGKSSVETWMWFLTNRYNSLRWAWTVPLGWHAEWFWDPLAGSEAEFGGFGFFLPSMPAWAWYGSWWNWHHAPLRGFRRAAVSPESRPMLTGLIPERGGKHYRVWLKEDALLRERLHTDPGLGSLRRARRLDPRPVRVARSYGGGLVSRAPSAGARVPSRLSGPAGRGPSAGTRVPSRLFRAPRPLTSAPVVVALPKSKTTNKQ